MFFSFYNSVKFIPVCVLVSGLWWAFTFSPAPPPLSPPTSETSRPHRNTPVIILTLILFSWCRHQSSGLSQPVTANNKLLFLLPFHLFLSSFFPSGEMRARSVRSSRGCTLEGPSTLHWRGSRIKWTWKYTELAVIICEGLFRFWGEHGRGGGETGGHKSRWGS